MICVTYGKRSRSFKWASDFLLLSILFLERCYTLIKILSILFTNIIWQLFSIRFKWMSDWLSFPRNFQSLTCFFCISRFTKKKNSFAVIFYNIFREVIFKTFPNECSQNDQFWNCWRSLLCFASVMKLKGYYVWFI